jgi:hypothetical protein
MIQLKEKINLEKAEFLLNLPNPDFEALVWTDTDDSKGNKFMKKESYIKEIKPFLKLHLETDGEVPVKYDYSKNMKTDGRLFANKFSLQKAKKNVRGFLCSETENDYDMVNAHPSILRYIMKTYYPEDFDKTYPALNDYINDRDKFIYNSGLSKKDVLTLMNSEYKKQLTNNAANKIYQEFLTIQNKLWNELPCKIEKYQKFKKTGNNKKGRFINAILNVFENKILMEIVEHYNNEYGDNSPISSLIFDGLHISSQLEDQTNILNEITKKYGVVWAIKEFDLSIQESEVYQNRSPPAYGYESNTYEDVKREFEKTHFMVKKPLGFVELDEDDGSYYNYKSQEFQIVTAHYKYTDTSKGKLEQQSIYRKWIDDPNKRQYKNIDFIPSLKECPKHTYNTFKGFPFMDYDEVDFEFKPNAIELFEKQISILVNHEEHVKDYFIKYFADIFQNPTKLPGVALVIKSDEGWGKDMLIHTLQLLLSKELVFRTETMDHIFGSFNGNMKNKLLIQLNEMNGKHGFENKDVLKGIITSETLTINEKGKESYEQKHFARHLITTNGITPICLPAGSRRYTVTQASPIKPPREHFDKYWAMLEDKDALRTLMEYLMGIDLSNFKITDIPETEESKNMKHRNIPVIYHFMDEMMVGDNYKKMFDDIDIVIKDDKVRIKKNVFKRKFMTWAVENGFNVHSILWCKQVEPLLHAIHISTRKKGRFGNEVRGNVEFHTTAVINSLVNKVVKESDENTVV